MDGPLVPTGLRHLIWPKCETNRNSEKFKNGVLAGKSKAPFFFSEFLTTLLAMAAMQQQQQQQQTKLRTKKTKKEKEKKEEAEDAIAEETM